MTDTSSSKREALAKELIALPVGTNKPLCWDMEVLIDFILAHQSAAIREARIDELTKFEPFFKGDHSKCIDPASCIGYQNAQSDFDNEKEIRLAQLKDKE